MLSAVGSFGSCCVNDPLAGAVSRNIGLVAARALMPVVGAVILPLCAVAVGMAGRRILIGGLELHIITGHGEGGSRLGGVCQGDIALQHNPLVKDLACLRCVRRNGHNGVLLDLVGDGGACGNGGRALDNRERIRLYGVFGELCLNRYIVCGHGEGGGGAGLVSQRYAACLNDPLNEVCSGRSLRRNGDLNALHGAGDGSACGNGCRAAGDGNGVIPQGGDLGILAALSMAAGAFLVLLAGLIQRRFLIHYPYPGMLGGFGVVCGFAGLLALGAGTAMGGFINLRPCGEVVGLHLEIVACCAGLDMRTGVHVYPRLRVGIVGMGDRLISSGHRHIMAGHGEGVVGCDRNITHPLIKHLTVRSRICGQSNLCALRRFTDFASCTDCRFAVRYDDGILFTLPDCIEGSIRAYFIGRAGNNRTVGTG